jgi:hypothetical protein
MVVVGGTAFTPYPLFYSVVMVHSEIQINHLAVLVRISSDL